MKKILLIAALLAGCNVIHNPPTQADVVQLKQEYAIFDAGMLIVRSLPKCTAKCQTALIRADGALYTAIHALEAWVNAPGAKGSAENIIAKVNAALSAALDIAHIYNIKV